MAIIKCKVCGGDPEINESMTVGVCKYCGSTMTLPGQVDESKANLYNRANDLRRNNEFDRSASIYESILNQFSQEAEAYWGLVLCKYGVEYVEDPETHKMVPTCHRTLTHSIMADADYKMAIEYADTEAQVVYESEAKVIESIQKQILALSMDEDPFDVFISYKEKTESGTRTKDSYRAQELYDLLTREGFKVFFSRITLEEKLGEAWEPTIFAALNSAKVMVVIGSKREFFYSPWVKNEWGRYLKLIKVGSYKTLIPAYIDMDPYDLPDEFSHLQAQDMTKLGFMQDLVRGIKKIVGEDKKNETTTESQVFAQQNITVNSLLERAFLCLELGDINKADEILEQVLNIDPKNPKAYIGKLLYELDILSENQLSKANVPLENFDNFQLAIRFADEEYKELLINYNRSIVNRLEEERKENIYQEAQSEKESCRDETDYLSVENKFLQILGYKDADNLANECRALANEVIYRRGINQKNYSHDENGYLTAVETFRKIGGYKDADSLVTECVFLAKESIYSQGLRKKSNRHSISDLLEAAKLFKIIPDYKDSENLRSECFVLVEKIQRHKKQKPFIVFASISFIIFAIIFLFVHVIPNRYYLQGLTLLEDKNYANAAESFLVAKNYKDSAYKAQQAYYLQGLSLLEDKSYVKAAESFLSAKNYKDSANKAQQAYYLNGRELIDNGKTFDAAISFTKAGNYRDSISQARMIFDGFQRKIACGIYHTVGLNENGTVVAVGLNDEGQLNVGNWSGIIAVAAGDNHTVGLKNDGTVKAVGSNSDGQLNVSGWRDIVAIAAGPKHTTGLRSDGSVIHTPDELVYENISEIVALSGNGWYGYKPDGTLVLFYTSSEGKMIETQWKETVVIAHGKQNIVGLRKDGSVLYYGSEYYDRPDVSKWQDIILLTAGQTHIVGVSQDGTVKAIGWNKYNQCNVSGWIDIVAVAAGNRHTVGLKSDGKVVATGQNRYGELNVTGWDLFD